MEQAASSGAKEGQGTSRWLRATWPGTELRKSRSFIYHAAPALPRASPSQSERSRFLASLAPPEKRAAGAAGVSSDRSRRLALPQASIIVVVLIAIGGAPEKNGLLILAIS